MFRRSVSVLALFAIPLITALASAAPPEKAPPEKSPQTQTAPAAAEIPKPLVIPNAEKNRKNPVPATPESIEAGQGLFASQCAMCHGAKGDGRGDLTRRLNLTVPDFTRSAIQKKRTDGELFYILSKGHGEMPGETRLDEQDRWAMINYIRSLLREEKPKH